MNFPEKTVGVPARSHLPRRGLSALETLVAATLVLAVIGFIAPLVVQSARIWKQTQHFQFAVDELSGQMDRLIALSSDDRAEAMDRLTVSMAAGEVLDDVTLAGRVVRDDDGRRIILTIDWTRIGNPPPVRLVAWIDPLPSGRRRTSRPKTTSMNPRAGTEVTEAKR